MRLEFESGPELMMLDNSASGEHPEENATISAYEMLQEGIKAAQAGDRAEARALLLGAAELDPSSENTWLWLASISEYPEELLEFLDNVLAMNPSHERALDWAAGTKSLLSKTFVQRGIDAVQESRPDVAVEHFEHAIQHDDKNAVAWHWLASLSDSSEREVECLEKVLAVDPENESARVELTAARNRGVNNKLADAQVAAVAGHAAGANEILDAVLAETPDSEDAWILKSHLADGFDEKVKCFERILEINPENEAAKFGLDSLKTIFEAVKPKPKKACAVTDEQPVDLKNKAALGFGNNTGEMIDEIMEVEVETHEEQQMFDSFKETKEETPFEAMPAIDTDESFDEFTNFDPPRPQEARDGQQHIVPAHDSYEAISMPLEPFDPTETDSGHTAKGKTILVVDDSPTVRNLLSAEFEKCGHNVLCSASGSEAMDRLRDTAPDLILLDIAMPGMDGYQVCAMIRGNQSTENVPVVMISGNDGVFDKVRGRMAGSTGYISKPFGPETLMKAVETYLVSAEPADVIK